MNDRINLGNGTYIEDERYCYPSGSIFAGRRAFAYDPLDKINRLVKIGIPDTFFSIAGRVSIKGKTIKVYITIDEGIVTMNRERV